MRIRMRLFLGFFTVNCLFEKKNQLCVVLSIDMKRRDIVHSARISKTFVRVCHLGESVVSSGSTLCKYMIVSTDVDCFRIG